MPKKDTRLISGMPGMGITMAAKKLGVTTTRLKGWLESWKLKGLKIHGGRWKIDQKDIVDFGRDYIELVAKKGR